MDGVWQLLDDLAADKLVGIREYMESGHATNQLSRRILAELHDTYALNRYFI